MIFFVNRIFTLYLVQAFRQRTFLIFIFYSFNLKLLETTRTISLWLIFQVPNRRLREQSLYGLYSRCPIGNYENNPFMFYIQGAQQETTRTIPLWFIFQVPNRKLREQSLYGLYSRHPIGNYENNPFMVYILGAQQETIFLKKLLKLISNVNGSAWSRSKGTGSA